MRLLAAWRLPARLARRDALRHRGRSLLVLVMIALPVLAVTAADVLMQTTDVDGVESLDRRLGAADARVQVDVSTGKVEQAPDPDDFSFGREGDGTMATASEVAALLDGARLLELRTGEAEVRTDAGAVTADVTEVDLADPATRGMFDLRSGRWPQDADEVVVNQALVDRGYEVGVTFDRPGSGGVDPVVVGIAESAWVRDYPVAAGPLGAFGLESEGKRVWLIDGGPVSWETVRDLNDIGATVTSRAVITDPPPESQWPQSVRGASDFNDFHDGDTVAVLVLVVVMALIEVVLLAGPAFAVGARKQQHSLALLAAAGGTPHQARRVVVAGALVIGSLAAALGVVLGIAAARLLVPVVQDRSSSYLGPFDVPWPHLAGVAAFGVLSAFLAAVVPAHIASRQDVVAVLAGRRGDRAPSLASPLLGLVLLGAGVAGSVVGATGGGDIMIAASAIPAVLGMILVIPLVLAGLGAVGGRLPLVLRYAIRDAARHRTRTVPAVAAVAATMTGAVALGIGLTSDELQRRETYSPILTDGLGVLTVERPGADWDALRAVVNREAPDAAVTNQLGISDYRDDGNDVYSQVTAPGAGLLLGSFGTNLGATLLVSDGDLPPGLSGLDAVAIQTTERALRSGALVAFTSPEGEVDGDTAEVITEISDEETGRTIDRTKAEVPAVFVPVDGQWVGPAAVLSPVAARMAGLKPTVVALVLGRDQVDTQQEQAIQEAIGGIDPAASLYVERGYRADDQAVIAQLILVGLGAILMLGGTLTATFLALSDARPDLATLAAVGASPRTRRGVAASYAFVVGFVGAVLGALVGFVPGVAITYPLTASSGENCVVNGSGVCVSGPDGPGPFLDVPWLMVIGLVIALPLLTAGVVGLFARSRLPLVSRLG